jgi:lincosamide nucleotidyltransferase A/C/D/E
MTMSEPDAVEILEWLGEGEVAVWLMGGWGVDALVGEQTREHEDLDLIVRDAEVSRMSDVLYVHGFLLSRGAQGGFNIRDERERLVDVHPVRFGGRGNVHFESEDPGAVRTSSRRLHGGGEHRGAPRRLPVCRSADGEPRMRLYAG